MDRSYAIIDKDGSIQRKTSVIPLVLKPNTRLSVRYTGPYVNYDLGRLTADIKNCKCQISSRSEYRVDGTTVYYHEYEIVGTDIGIIQQMMSIVEVLFGVKEVVVKLDKEESNNTTGAQVQYESDSDKS